MRNQIMIMQQQVHNAAEQVIAAQGTNNRISHQIRIMQAANEQTNRLIEQARTSAEAASQNIELYISKERAKLRVEMKPLRLPDKPDIAYMVDFSVSIYGPTDAFITDSLCVAYAFPEQVMGDPELGEAVMFPIHVLPAVIRANSEPLDCYAFLALNSEEVIIPEVKARNFFVRIRGFIKYKDVFDRERVTAFRYMWRFMDMYGPSSEFGEWVKNGKPEENRET